MHTNPMGTDGFEFVEFAGLEASALSKLFESLGFSPVANHRSKSISLYQQNDIQFLLNTESQSFAEQFAKQHGPSACGMAFRVSNAKYAYNRALSLGARPYEKEKGPKAIDAPAIYGIGDSLLYFCEREGKNEHKNSSYLNEFIPIKEANSKPKGYGLQFIDHLTHNVFTGQMDTWAEYYQKLFNFREIRFFDIQGQHSGLISRALTSPCNKIRIPLNESKDPHSQIAEYLQEYKGEGIQHIALSTENIFETIEALKNRNIAFLDTPNTYYELLEKRLPDHGEDLTRMQKNQILIDGGEKQGGGFLLQIFTKTVIGPIFFEIIQRKGNEGFGEGNFQALFESIELDQIRRGVIQA